MTEEDRVACRTPAQGREGVTRMPAWKSHLVCKAILHAVEAAGPEGLTVSLQAGAVQARLSGAHLARLGVLGWHCTTVKLETEVAGEIVRVPGPGPQRLILA